MMAMTACAVKCEFQAVSFAGSGPIICSWIDIQVVYEIACTGSSLDQEKLKEITVRQMTVDTLSRKPLGILATMNRILPRNAEGGHNMATDTKLIGICGFNHKTGSKNRYDRQNNAYYQPEPPTLFTGLFWCGR